MTFYASQDISLDTFPQAQSIPDVGPHRTIVLRFENLKNSV